MILYSISRQRYFNSRISLELVQFPCVVSYSPLNCRNMSWIRNFFSFALLATAATTVLASVNHEVTVGKGALLFSPETTVAQPGDTITFHFFPKVANRFLIILSNTNTLSESFRHTIVFRSTMHTTSRRNLLRLRSNEGLGEGFCYNFHH